MRSRVLRLPRAGNRDSEYEDGFALPRSGTFPYRAAIADGATESAFAGAWADVLATAWVESDVVDEQTFVKALPEWQERWSRRVAPRSAELPWYAAAKVEEGAFAAFLGISIDGQGTWQALAVGDCCLFHLRGGGATSWPLDSPEAFTNTPDLIPSTSNRSLAGVLRKSGAWSEDDVFILATDAAAAWLMRAGPEAALSLTPETFADRTARAREEGKLRNDDQTIVVLEIIRHTGHQQLTTNS